MKKLKIFHTLLACVISFYAYSQNVVSKSSRFDIMITTLQLQNEIFYPVSVFSNPQRMVEEGIGPYTQLDIDLAELKKVFQNNHKCIRLEIPLPGNKSEYVLLMPHKIFSDDFEFTTSDVSGKRRQTINKGLYYYGIIENKPNSLAAISIFDNDISGVISDETGNWNLGLRKNESGKYVFFNDHTFKLPIEFNCGTKDPDVIVMGEKNGGSNNINATYYSGNCVKIFFDCDYNYFFSELLSISGVTNHATSIFNVMSAIYAHDSIELNLSSINVWTTADPFDHTNTGNALQSVQSYYSTHPYNGYLVAMLSTHPNISGGMAYINTNLLCGSYACNVNGINVNAIGGFPTYSWDVNVVGQECGHNMGCPHTHSCSWVGGPLDNCNQVCWNPAIPNDDGTCQNGPPVPSSGGSIMSYCYACSQGVNFANGLWAQPAALIKLRISQASCINVCSSCNTNLSLTGNTGAGESDSWWASNEITVAGSIILTNGSTNLNAGVDIILSPNFEVQPGGIFHAAIGCTPTTSPVANSNNNTANSNSERVGDTRHTATDNDLLISPNPFSTSFNIEINLTEDVNVSVKIYDLMGRQIDVISDNELKQKGKLQLQYNSEKLQPNIYMCVVTVNGKQFTKKIVKM